MMRESEDLQYAFHKELTATPLGRQGWLRGSPSLPRKQGKGGKGA